ncbi:hypothetical protein GMJAKD_13585 [Candidatus Electrothrix aarhusensis]
MSKRFDQKARELDEHPVMREIALKFSQTFLTHVPLTQNCNILDYGCGSGLIGMHLYLNAKSIIMMDTSEGMLNILKEKIQKNDISNMEIMNCELEKAQIEPKSSDVIYMNNVLHHIEDVSAFLTVAKKILKPKGYLCIGDFEKEDGSFHDDNSDVRHFGFEEHEIDKYLANCSLKKIKRERYYTIKKPDNSGQMQQYPLFFISAIKA